jgi:hypothetical protein
MLLPADWKFLREFSSSSCRPRLHAHMLSASPIDRGCELLHGGAGPGSREPDSTVTLMRSRTAVLGDIEVKRDKPSPLRLRWLTFMHPTETRSTYALLPDAADVVVGHM